MKSTLDSGLTHSGINKGFKINPRDRKVETYSQERHALTYVYLKRHLQSDGIRTEPLHVTLKSCKKL